MIEILKLAACLPFLFYSSYLLHVIGTLVPVYPVLEFYGYTFPLLGFPPAGLFALTVLENSLFLTAAVPLGLFCYNILHFTICEGFWRKADISG